MDRKKRFPNSIVNDIPVRMMTLYLRVDEVLRTLPLKLMRFAHCRAPISTMRPKTDKVSTRKKSSPLRPRAYTVSKDTTEV